MSAFFVGADHINAILSVVQISKCSAPLPDGNWSLLNDARTLTEIGKALLAENIKSLQARYPRDWQEMVTVDVNSYSYRFDHEFAGGSTAAVAVIKLCHSYCYQCCEHDEWDESYAKRFADFVVDYATSNLPGYNAAPWCYERPDRASGSRPGDMAAEYAEEAGISYSEALVACNMD